VVARGTVLGGEAPVKLASSDIPEIIWGTMLLTMIMLLVIELAWEPKSPLEMAIQIVIAAAISIPVVTAIVFVNKEAAKWS